MTTIIIIVLVLLFAFGFYAGFRKDASRDKSVDRIQQNMAARMDSLNDMQPYQPQLVPVRIDEKAYEPIMNIEQDIENALEVMGHLSAVLDIDDPEQPIWFPQNLDMYLDSWRIMRFMDFGENLDKESHFFMLHLACGKYFCEQHGFVWKNKSMGEEKELVVLHEETGMELSPIDSVLRSISRNETDVFTALEQTFVSCLADRVTKIRIE